MINRVQSACRSFPRPLRELSSALRCRASECRSESGAVAIETAVSFLLVMTMVLGIIECCMMVYTLSVLGDAARHGVRYATIHGAASSICSGPSAGCVDPTAANVATDVTTYAARFTANLSGMTVVVSYPDAGGSTTPSRVTVQVSGTYLPLFGIPGTSQKFQAISQGRILF